MKKNYVIIAIMAKHIDLQIAHFLKTPESLFLKFAKKLDDNGKVSPAVKRKEHQLRSHSIRTHEFIQQAPKI